MLLFSPVIEIAQVLDGVGGRNRKTIQNSRSSRWDWEAATSFFCAGWSVEGNWIWTIRKLSNSCWAFRNSNWEFVWYFFLHLGGLEEFPSIWFPHLSYLCKNAEISRILIMSRLKLDSHDKLYNSWIVLLGDKSRAHNGHRRRMVWWKAWMEAPGNYRFLVNLSRAHTRQTLWNQANPCEWCHNDLWWSPTYIVSRAWL